MIMLTTKVEVKYNAHEDYVDDERSVWPMLMLMLMLMLTCGRRHHQVGQS